MRASVAILGYIGLNYIISHIQPELLAAVVLKGVAFCVPVSSNEFGNSSCRGEQTVPVVLEWPGANVFVGGQRRAVA